MKQMVFLTNSGKIFRKDNTISFVPSKITEVDEDLLLFDKDNFQYLNNEKRNLPVEQIESINIMAEVNLTKKLFELAAYKGIMIHFYNYYNQYVGSFVPANSSFDGNLIIGQVNCVNNLTNKILIAQKIISSAISNLNKNLIYYKNRGRNLEDTISKVKENSEEIFNTGDINSLMLVEAKIRKLYYSAFNQIILSEEIKYTKREFYPPKDEINALLSFLNSLVYSLVLNELSKTSLHPGISFIHAPGQNKVSLVWDFAEIFKPIISDRILFGLINRKRINKSHFEFKDEACYLNKEGKKIVIEKFNEKVNEPIEYNPKERAASLRTIIRNEFYKLIRFIENNEPYKPFKINW